MDFDKIWTGKKGNEMIGDSDSVDHPVIVAWTIDDREGI